MPRPPQGDAAVAAVMRTLIREGRDKGSLTYDDIVAAFEDHELGHGELERFLSDLTERGIEVIESERPEVEPETTAVDLTIDPSLDSLRLYLRSIGRVPLLAAVQIAFLLAVTVTRPLWLFVLGSWFDANPSS